MQYYFLMKQKKELHTLSLKNDHLFNEILLKVYKLKN